MILSDLSDDQKKEVISNKLKSLLKLTHNYDLLQIVDYLSLEETKKCYIKILNSYNERPFYLKKNNQVGIYKIR